MCTGMEIAAMVAGPLLGTAGGIIQQNEMQANNERMAEARNERLRNTLVKNDQLAKQSRAEFDARKQQIKPEETDKAQKEATQERQETLETAVPEAPVSAPVSGSAPTVVKSELAKRMGEAMQGAKQQAKNLGALGGYGDMWLDQGFKDVTAGRGIAQDANFAAGNMAILPFQQDIAEMRAYKPISPLGGLLQGFGSGISSFAGGGGALPKKSYRSPNYFNNTPGLY